MFENCLKFSPHSNKVDRLNFSGQRNIGNFFPKANFWCVFWTINQKNQTSLTKYLNVIYVARVKLGHQNTRCLWCRCWKSLALRLWDLQNVHILWCVHSPNCQLHVCVCRYVNSLYDFLHHTMRPLFREVAHFFNGCLCDFLHHTLRPLFS